MSAKILLARKLRNETRAHSILVGDTGFYWRDLPAEADLLAELRGERFSLIIVDHRDLADDPLAFVESLRRWQKDTPVLVVSEQLALENVIRAIRVGVKDLFHPPIDLGAMVERIYSVLKPELGTARSARLDEWSELMMQLTDTDAAPPVHGSRAGFPGRAAPMSETAGEPDRFAVELKTTRDAMAEAKARQAALEEELARLKSARPTAAPPRPAADGPSDAELAAEREKLETEQLVLAQQRKKFDTESAAKKAAETTARAEQTKREQALTDRNRQLTAAQDKLQAEILQLAEAKTQLEEERAATGETRTAQKETETKLKQLVIEQVALTKAREKHERDCTVWQAVRTKAEAEFARREQAMAEAQAEAAHLAAEQEKFEAAQLLFEQASAKQEQERTAWGKTQSLHQEAVARTAAKDAELAHALKSLAVKERAHAEAVEQHAAEQEKWESERLVALQVQAKFAKDRAALDKAAAAHHAEAEKLTAQRDQFAAEHRKAAEDLAQREDRLAQLEKELAPRKAELAAAREKLEAEQLLAKQTLAKATSARNEAETLRAELQQQTRELADKETALQEAEVQVQTQTAQNLKLQAQIEQERAAQAADKVTLEQETAALAERVWLFESKQKQIKEQMKQLLAAS